MYFAPPRPTVAGTGLRGDSIYTCSVFPACVTHSWLVMYCALLLRHEVRMDEKVFEMVVFGYLVLGLASGLEAFSREPPCDSIGALATRQTP